jgi:hypothetical protein
MPVLGMGVLALVAMRVVVASRAVIAVLMGVVVRGLGAGGDRHATDEEGQAWVSCATGAVRARPARTCSTWEMACSSSSPTWSS